MKNPIAFPIISRLASGVAKFFGALHAVPSERESNVHISENHIRPLRANSFRETTRDMLDRHPALQRHPKNPAGTKYIRTYKAINGRLLAHDLPGTKSQALWVSADGFPLDLVRDIPVEVYPAGRPRNSNLKAYPPLGDGKCLRFKPSTADEVRRIADALTANS